MEHATVLRKEACDALVWDESGVYIDGTFGRGGHAQGILQRLNSHGRLHAFDKDPQAVTVGAELARADRRFAIHRGSFTGMKSLADQQHIAGKLAGILLDLGMSSPQLDAAERGFSFLQDGPLDMRMNPEQGISAADWLAEVDEQELARVLKDYGEERFARRIAAAIVDARSRETLSTTVQLAEIIKQAHPRWEKDKHPATRSFQAIRIFINHELSELEEALSAVPDLLGSRGRLVVISFHSLEDRIAKRFMRDASRPPKSTLPKNIPLRDEPLSIPKLRLVGKATRCTAEEVLRNRRARSAVMRVAEKAA